MSAQHTPGPWWTTDSGVRDVGGYICFTNAATHYEGQDERFALEVAERAANKQLISAAPDLLAALQELTAAMIDDGQADRLCVRLALAAIAKATGSAA